MKSHIIPLVQLIHYFSLKPTNVQWIVQSPMMPNIITNVWLCLNKYYRSPSSLISSIIPSKSNMILSHPRNAILPMKSQKVPSIPTEPVIPKMSHKILSSLREPLIYIKSQKIPISSRINPVIPTTAIILTSVTEIRITPYFEPCISKVHIPICLCQMLSWSILKCSLH